MPQGDSEPFTVIPKYSHIKHVCHKAKNSACAFRLGKKQFYCLTIPAKRGGILQVDLATQEKELFVALSVAPWFTADVKLGSLAIHLELPSCFAAGKSLSLLLFQLRSEQAVPCKLLWEHRLHEHSVYLAVHLHLGGEKLRDAPAHSEGSADQYRDDCEIALQSCSKLLS